MLIALHIFFTLQVHALFDRSQGIYLFRSYQSLCSFPLDADDADDDDDDDDADNEHNDYHDGNNDDD